MPAQWKSGYTVVAICITLVVVGLIAATTVTIVVGGTDPDVFLRFLAGPAISSILTTFAVTYLTIVNRKVTKLNNVVEQVQENTNGNTSALLRQIKQLTDHLAQSTPIEKEESK